MKHKEKLKALEKAIREALPELMEVKTGCIVKDKHGSSNMILPNNKVVDVLGYVENYYKSIFPEILGHEIQLHHVLKWLGIVFMHCNDIMRIDAWGYLGHYTACENVESGEKFIHSTKWNLYNPLKDQNKKLIDYLYSLIITND